MCFQVFDPFDITLVCLPIPIDIVVSNADIVILITIILYTTIRLFIFNNNFIGTILGTIPTIIVDFVLVTIKNQVGYQPTVWASLYSYISSLILMVNHTGLLPYGSTLTSHFTYVLVPTFTVLFGIFYRTITDNFINYTVHFIPKNVPLIVGIVLVITEVISYMFRAISLPIRVFANMVAGHILLFFIATALAMQYDFCKNYMLKVSVLAAFLLWVAIYSLELLVAFLQAYVFLIMISIYAKDMGTSFDRQHEHWLDIIRLIYGERGVEKRLAARQKRLNVYNQFVV
jgi:ATP synthase subunit 6